MTAISVQVYKSNGAIIETGFIQNEFKAKEGMIASYSLIVDNPRIAETTNYNFSVKITNPLSPTGFFKIILPPDIVSTRPINTLNSFSCMINVSPAYCYQNTSSEILAKPSFLIPNAPNLAFNIYIEGIQNSIKAYPTTAFEIISYYNNENFSVDSTYGLVNKVIFQSHPGALSPPVLVRSSFIVTYQSTYTFQFRLTHGFYSGGFINITFPNAFVRYDDPQCLYSLDDSNYI